MFRMDGHIAPVLWYIPALHYHSETSFSRFTIEVSFCSQSTGKQCLHLKKTLF